MVVSEKPRMRHVITFDCGWKYEWWMCHGKGMKAFGNTQEEAYKSWCAGLKAIRANYG